MSKPETFWNGAPTKCLRGTVRVTIDKRFPRYWAVGAGLLGKRIDVVKVINTELGGVTFYIDNRCGQAWEQVTTHFGDVSLGHRNLAGADFEEAT